MTTNIALISKTVYANEKRISKIEKIIGSIGQRKKLNLYKQGITFGDANYPVLSNLNANLTTLTPTHTPMVVHNMASGSDTEDIEIRLPVHDIINTWHKATDTTVAYNSFAFDTFYVTTNGGNSNIGGNPMDAQIAISNTQGIDGKFTVPVDLVELTQEEITALGSAIEAVTVDGNVTAYKLVGPTAVDAVLPNAVVYITKDISIQHTETATLYY